MDMHEEVPTHRVLTRYYMSPHPRTPPKKRKEKKRKYNYEFGLSEPDL